ncbi:MAG: hypothetical protein BWY28_03132 [bacterium ADurb.Bin236]|nr:MAG: hypothetical protein BWY28_03132 [bacterium ADurb.Bin236]
MPIYPELFNDDLYYTTDDAGRVYTTDAPDGNPLFSPCGDGAAHFYRFGPRNEIYRHDIAETITRAA